MKKGKGKRKRKRVKVMGKGMKDKDENKVGKLKFGRLNFLPIKLMGKKINWGKGN